MPVHSRRFHLLGGDWLYLQSCAGPHKTMLTGKIVGRVLETCSKQAAVPRRLGPLDRLRATQGCGIGSSCRSHATLEIDRFPVFEARCTGSSNSQTVWPAGLELQLVCNDGSAGGRP